ncbi:MAG: formyltransferase family protein [bacterium]|nr:formyltransferase family protein [bacterium]
MRIVLLIPQLHAGTELVLNRLLKQKNLNVVGIIRSAVSPFRRSYWRYAAMGVKKAGFFYGAQIAIFAYLHRIVRGVSRLLFWRKFRFWLSTDELIERYQINLSDTEDVNSHETLQVLESWKPDVLITLYFDQILKKSVLRIPKQAALNLHPGGLPLYRGLWPDFWQLLHGEKRAGVTLHHLNEQIDAGDVIAHMNFPIHKKDTKFSLGLRSAQHGAKLLIRVLQQMRKGIKLPMINLPGKPRYFSLPKKADFDTYYSKGKKLFSLGELQRELGRWW